MKCKICDSVGKIIESKVVAGRRKRRYLCENGHRWGVVGDFGDQTKIKKNPSERSLSPDQVKFILLSTLSNRKIAEELSVGIGPVTKVRLGECYADLFPEIDRSTIPSKLFNKNLKKGTKVHYKLCTGCIHWDTGCSIGIPDQITLGTGFAHECAAFFACPE